MGAAHVTGKCMGRTCIARVDCGCHTHCRLGLRVSHMRQTLAVCVSPTHIVSKAVGAMCIADSGCG